MTEPVAEITIEHPTTGSVSVVEVSLANEPTDGNSELPHLRLSDSPNLFQDCCFSISGPLSMKKNDFRKLLKQHGASFSVSVSRKTTHLITSQTDFESRSEQVEKALERDGSCILVNEQFVFDSISSGTLKDPKSYQFLAPTSSASASSPSSSTSESSSSSSSSSESSVAATAAASSTSTSTTRSTAQKFRARTSSSVTPKKAPQPKKPKYDLSRLTFATWWVDTGSPTFGIYVDDEVALCANDNGWVLAVDKETGEIKTKVKLPAGVKVLKRDIGGFLYASCDDGSLYDITNLNSPKLMRSSPSEGKRSIMWSDIHNGNLVFSQENGRCTSVDIENFPRWEHHEPYSACWVVRTDGSTVYYSGDNVLIAVKYADGETLWKRKIAGLDHLTYGTLLDSETILLAGEGVYEFKVNGAGCKPRRGDNSDNPEWELLRYLAPRVRNPEVDDEDYDVEEEKDKGADWEDWFYSCAATDTQVFAGGEEHLYVFPRGDVSPESRIELDWNFGTSMGMQIFGDSLYVVTENGGFLRVSLAKLSNEAATRISPVIFDEYSDDGVIKPITSLTAVSNVNTSAGVVVECVKEGGKLRVRSATEGYNSDWYVQFPISLRKAGSKYLVDELLVPSEGGYYRAKGEIKLLSQ